MTDAPQTQLPEGMSQEEYDALPTIVEKPRIPFVQVQQQFLIHMGSVRRGIDAAEGKASLKKIAQKIGISTAELQRWENGAKNGASPTLIQTDKWCQSLGFELEITIRVKGPENTTTTEEAIRKLAESGQGIPVPSAVVTRDGSEGGALIERHPDAEPLPVVPPFEATSD